MTIYTSYFAYIKKLPENIIPVSISLYPPKGYTGLQYKKLAPTPEILSGIKADNDVVKYIYSYKEQVLDKLDKEEVLKELESLSDGKDIALCCFEKPEDFCHRKIVAKWLGIKEFSDKPVTEPLF